MAKQAEMVTYPGAAGEVPAYLSRPDGDGPHPALIVIHEIWGLSEHIQRVADRFSAQGYVVLAPNLFARPGLADVMVPEQIRETMTFMNGIGRERLGDRDYVAAEIARLPAGRREMVARTLPVMTGGMPRDAMTADLVKAVGYLKSQKFVNGKVGSLGFCFGGGMSIYLACHAAYDACVVFYGENPTPIELVEQIACPVFGLYGAEDKRINIRLDELVRAMVEYQKDFQMKIYPGAAHAFFNDSNPHSYRPAQAQDAWEKVLAFFGKTLV